MPDGIALKTTRIAFLCCVASLCDPVFALRAGEPAGADERDKPLVLGEIAYTGGAFTPDGRYFVYAMLPKDKAQASEVRAADTRSGKVESLGAVPLLQQQPKAGARDMFRWSMGVLAAENDLATIYLGQYGPNVDLSAKDAIAWGVKDKAVIPGKQLPAEATVPKENAGPKDVKLTLIDLDADAMKLRTEYQPVEKVPGLLGKKELTIEIAAGGKDASAPTKPIQVNVTDAFRDLYAAAVKDYPNNRFGGESGSVLVSDSVEPLVLCGPWVFVHCGFYAHYGIHGRGYGRLAAINIAAPRLVLYPGLGSYSASGVRMGPIEHAFLRAPDGKSVAGISNGQVTLYRVPAE